MKKLAVVLVLVLAVSVAGTALAAPNGAGKAPLYDSVEFTCSGGATATDGPVYGFVVLNTNGKPGLKAVEMKDLIVQVSLKGATPNATYDIWVNQDPGACPLGSLTATGALVTNGEGNGNAHVTVTRVAGAANFWVSAVGGGQVLRSTAVPLD